MSNVKLTGSHPHGRVILRIMCINMKRKLSITNCDPLSENRPSGVVLQFSLRV